MLVTVNNTSGEVLNDLDVFDSGPANADIRVLATGGHIKNPLPYPFRLNGTIAIAGTKQLAMHPSDWHKKDVLWQSMDPRNEWQQLVQAGKVTLTVAAQTGRRDQEELFLNAV